MRRLTAIGLLFSACVVGIPQSIIMAQTLSCNFYASPNGSGNGLTYASPSSVTGAQDLAQAQPAAFSNRVVCLEAGTYQISNNWTAADQYETWTPYSGQGTVTFNASSSGTIKIQSNNITFYGITWTGLNGLNGTGATPSAMVIDGSAINLLWNNFQSCEYECIYGVDWTNSELENNTFSGIAPGNFPNGSPGNFATAVNIGGGSSNVTMSHNACSNNQGGCLDVSSYSSTSNNNVMSCNETRDDQQSCKDCGDFYFQDSQEAGASTGTVITDNVVLGGGLNATKGIYLDNSASNTIVERNIIAEDGTGPGCSSSTSPAYGYCTPEFALQYHGGDNNTVENNILELIKWPSYTDIYGFISAGTFLAYYQSCVSPCGSMSGNTFERNILFQNAGWPTQQLWAIDAAGVQNPTVADNDYWSTMPTNWGFSDSSPYNLSPDFPNPSSNDFTPIGNSTLTNELSLPSSLPNCEGGSGPAGTGPIAYSVTISGVTATPTPTSVATPTLTATSSPTPARTPTPVPTLTVTPTSSPTSKKTPTPVPTSTVTLSPSPTATATYGTYPVACATSSNGGASGNVTVSVPPGTASGNLMLAEIVGKSSNLPVAPAGWSLIGNCTADGGGGAGCEFYRVASSEPSKYLWTSGAAGWWTAGVICTFAGENRSHPIDASGTPAVGNNTTPTVPSVTGTAAANDVEVGMFEVEGANFNKPADMKWGGVVQQNPGVNVGAAITYRKLTYAGASGGDSATMSAGVWTSQGVAIRPDR